MEVKMTSRTNGSLKKPEKLNHVKEMGPNWVVVIGGALLCTLSVRLCFKLRQIFDFKGSRKINAPSKGNGSSSHNKKYESCKLHSQLYCIIPDDDGCHQCCSGDKHARRSPLSKDNDDDSLPLVKIASAQSYIDNGVMWVSPTERLELPPKPFVLANSSDSTCISESGSDVYSRRDVIQKLRQQLRRRDDMVLEMQAEITALQNSLAVQTNHNTRLQAQLDSSNQDLIDSDREIKWLQKTISGTCSGKCAPREAANGHADGSAGVDLNWVGAGRMRGEDGIEMLKGEIEELKEVILGKEFLIQSYREQKIGLCAKLNELQLRLATQASTPSIL